ncbi:MAG: DUF2341 domain-containing protein [Candidatus Bathyarchaeota archaeon]|nr:DUF2341 domain-containing protein [Candidatus Bathyarchaeota archaeon]
MNLRKKLLSIILIILVIQSVVSFIDVTRVFGQQNIPSITLKWVSHAGTGSTWMGPWAADLNNDGKMEIVISGLEGKTAALDPDTGEVIWSVPYGGDHVPMEIVDLNKDGFLEIVMSPQKFANGTNTSGVMVLHGINGSIWWYNIKAAGKGTYIAVGDINADGYPEIFSAYPGLVTALTYDGHIFAKTTTYYTCYGGMSLADTNFDGVFEVYLGERGGKSYPQGRGLRAFWADNLTEIWAQPDIMCSSQAPTIADVDNDGDLEIIILHQSSSGGIAVFNTDGSVNTYKGKYRKNLNLGLPTHDPPTVADVDGDGNLELLTVRYEDQPHIWDLVDWKLDAKLPFICLRHPPGLADVDGDGQWEILDCNLNNVTIFKYNKATGKYDILPILLDGKLSYAIPLANAHSFFIAQDIDADGKLELVFNQHNSWISVYDVEVPIQKPLPLSGLTHYHQYRGSVPVYRPPPGPQEPRIMEVSPNDYATNVPVGLTELSFKLTDYQCDPINYTVTTNLDIGSASGINVSNGKITVPIIGLAYSTTYTWTITATDGTNTNTKTFTFTTMDLPPWYDTNWQYRKAIAIDYTKVAADQTYFPVLIDLTDPDLKAKARQDGADILFTDQNQSKLNHEIELYDNTTGRLIAWVNVPYLSSAVNTIIYMYYGNPDCENQQNPIGVWDANYKLVLHLNEKSGIHYDSTINGNNGIPFGNIVQGAAGYIGNCVEFKGGYIELPRVCTNETQFTFSAWIYPRLGARYIISEWSSSQGAFLQVSSDYSKIDFYVNGITVSRSITLDNWYYVVGTFDGTTAKLYINDYSPVSKSASNPLWPSQKMYIGDRSDHTRKFNGSIDEVRVSNVARDAAWILTEYNNQLNPHAFYIVCPEETFTDELVLTILIDGDGTIVKNPDKEKYAYGTLVKLTAVADVGYVFSHWECNLTGSNNPATILMTGNNTVKAVFIKSEYTLTINVNGSGSVSRNDTGPYYYGSAVQLEAIPDPHWEFIEWSGDHNGTNNPVTIIITGNTTITAHFAKQKYLINSSVEGTGGTIQPSGLVTVTYGQSQTFIITPDVGYHIYDVKVDGDSVGPVSSFTFNDVDANHTIIIVFAQNEYTLTIHVIGEGSVTLEPEKQFYLHGEVVQLTATPCQGWVFSGWSGDLSGIMNPINITMTGNKIVNVTFTTNQWWCCNWQYRRAIIIDNTKVNGELTDFPLLIEILDNGLVGKTQPDGDDIVFVDADNVKLDHQIEFYDSSMGHLIAWVRVPYLSSTANTVIYMYYGNPDCESQQNPAAVWQEGYQLVLHLNEKTGLHYDSTINGNNGTPLKGVLQGVPGKIDGADTFDGINDYIAIPHSDTLAGYTEAFTVSFWIKIEDTSKRQTILCKYDNNGNMRSWQIEYDPQYWQRPFWFFASENGITYREWWASWESFKPEANVWYYWTVVWEKNAIPKFYVNGVQVPTVGTATISSIFNNNGTPLYIGKSIYAGRPFKGSLDEITISNQACSADWILTTYNNQLNPSQFFSLGPEEEIFEETYVLTITIDGNGSVDINPEKAAYKQGENVTLTALPDEGYEFAGWTGDLESNEGSITITITKNMFITAHFTPKQYVIHASISGIGGIIQPSGLISVYYGENITFIIMPDLGYHIYDVVVDDVSHVSIDTYTFYSVNANHTIIAFFALNEYTLTINSLPSEGGTVAINKTAPYHYGDVVELTAIAEQDWVFKEWSGDISGSQNPKVIVIDGNKTITAVFTQIPSINVSNISINTTEASTPCNFSAAFTAENSNLSHYIFGTNNTGVWVNETAVFFGEGKTQALASIVKTLNSTIGAVIQWCIWANNTAGNWTSTGIQSFTTSGNQSTIATLTTYGYAAVEYACQRKIFYANGRFWVFYYDGAHSAEYSTSTDGFSWTPFTPFTSRTCGAGWRFAVAFDGTRLHYVFSTGKNGDPLYYRCGIPNADGTITWLDDERNITIGESDTGHLWPSIAVDSEGRPWVAYARKNATENSRYAYVTMSLTSNGTWITSPGFPYRLSPTNYTGINVMIVPLTNQKMLAIVSCGGWQIESYLWNGTAWSQKQTTTSAITGDGIIECGLSAVNQGDDVHLVFVKNSTHDLVYTKYSYESNSWGPEIIIQPTVNSETSPVLTIDVTTNKLYCFWAGAPTPNCIYYKVFNGSAWNFVEGSDPWIIESNLAGYYQYDGLSGFYQSYNNLIGLAYTIKADGVYQLKFAFLTTST